MRADRIALLLPVLVLSACVSLPHYDTGRVTEEGETRYLMGLSVGHDTGPMYKGQLPAIAATQDQEEIPAEDAIYPEGPIRVNYTLGVRHGLGDGFEVRAAADTWSPAGIGGTFGLKLQVAGDADSAFAGAISLRGAGAFAGAGDKDNGGGEFYGAGDLAFPMSLRTLEWLELLVAPRLSAGGFMVTQTKGGQERSASDGGVALGGSAGFAVGTDLLFILEIVSLYSPAHDAWVFAGGLGIHP